MHFTHTVVITAQSHYSNIFVPSGSTVDCQLNIAYTVISQYFKRRLDLANTIMILGASISMTVVPHLLTYLHAEYGFRGAILIVGGASLNLIPAGMVFHPVEWHSRKTVHTAKTQKFVDRTTKPSHLRVMLDAWKSNILLFKSARVVILSLPYSICFTVTTFTSSYIPFVMQATGYTLEETAHCLTMLGVFHGVTRIIHPFLTGVCHGNNFHILAGSYFAIPASIVGKIIDLLLLILYLTYFTTFNLII